LIALQESGPISDTEFFLSDIQEIKCLFYRNPVLYSDEITTQIIPDSIHTLYNKRMKWQNKRYRKA